MRLDARDDEHTPVPPHSSQMKHGGTALLHAPLAVVVREDVTLR